MPKVKFWNPGLAYMRNRNRYLNAIDNALIRGDLILRQDIEDFEKELTNYFNIDNAITCNSGTDALFMSMKVLGIKEGDEVITVSNTFKATITTIIHIGAKPVLVDIGDDYLMDMNKVEKVITEKTKAIMPVHLSGDMCDMIYLGQILSKQKQKIFIIEDACQAFGAQRDGIKAGTCGEAGCFSFYPAKIMGGFGDGGAIICEDSYTKGLSDELKEMRNHYKGRPDFGSLGYNSRLDNVWASILHIKLGMIDNILKRRQQIAELYREGLKDLPVVLPLYRDGRVWQDYIIRVDEIKRQELVDFLKDKEIETMIPPILPHQELELQFSLPKSDIFNKQFLRLPCNEVLENFEVAYVIERIKEFYES